MVKVSSMSVEFDIQLTKEEIEELETQVLQGILNHNEHDGLKRKIPFFLIYSHQEQDQMLINGHPRGYLGDANQLWITIFDYHYEKLKETGYCGDRIQSAIRINIANKSR